MWEIIHSGISTFCKVYRMVLKGYIWQSLQVTSHLIDLCPPVSVNDWTDQFTDINPINQDKNYFFFFIRYLSRKSYNRSNTSGLVLTRWVRIPRINQIKFVKNLKMINDHQSVFNSVWSELPGFIGDELKTNRWLLFTQH